MTNEKKQELDALCLKFRRTLIEILHEKQTGHPGGSLSVCEILTMMQTSTRRISMTEAVTRSFSVKDMQLRCFISSLLIKDSSR